MQQLCTVFCEALFAQPATKADFYVAINGHNSNPGTQQKPFATLQKARDAIRSLKQNDTLPVGVAISCTLANFSTAGKHIIPHCIRLSPFDWLDGNVDWNLRVYCQVKMSLRTILEKLREFDTALIANTLDYIDPTPPHEFYMGGSIRSVTPSLGPTAGIAVTCEVDTSSPLGAPDMDGYWRQLEEIQAIQEDEGDNNPPLCRSTQGGWQTD